MAQRLLSISSDSGSLYKCLLAFVLHRNMAHKTRVVSGSLRVGHCHWTGKAKRSGGSYPFFFLSFA